MTNSPWSEPNGGSAASAGKPVGPGQPTGQPSEPGGWRPVVGQAGPADGWTPTAQPAGGPPGRGSEHPIVPRCYRHQDRETYVSCQRCGRAICPDCMRPADVGFHCPEDAGAHGRRAGGSSRRPGTRLGGRAVQGRPGLVTLVLIGMCVAAYILQGLPGLGGGVDNAFTRDFALNGLAMEVNGEYYRLLTAAFLHASILHILLNMYALYLLGYPLEQILGRVRYLALFVVCAVGGNTLSYLINGWSTYSVGASTAVFGFFAAYYVIARRLQADTSAILVVVGINLIISFTISGIDKWGHIGGLVTGLVVGMVYAYIPPRRVWLQTLAVGGVLAALLVAAVVGV
ncbi:rhomboid family intramembrane serine protease [Frankia sp. Cas3]|uniref:rhomboid family intramembrane serine protease n=1 Tax=Frankia sp. Cas3 TaxID=3073926 RepID=UPI002AD1D224|nr:rhomboid family intramembrane serine protease [Frankia sp. Cas3]